MNKLGFYIQNSQGTHESIANVQPPVILMHAWDQGLLEDIRRFRAPDAFVIGRMDYIGQGGDKTPITQSLINSWLDGPDPAGRGRALAEHILIDNFQLAQRKGANGRLLVDAWMSLNECIPGPASSAYNNSQAERDEIERRLRAYDKLQAAFRSKLMEQGIEAVAFNFGAGNFTRAAHYLDFFPETLASYTYLGFHEYGWPAMRPDPAAGIYSSAGSYRPIVKAIRQKLGRELKVVITETGLARMFKHSTDGVGDVGWLYENDWISQDEYWASLDWYNDYLVEDDFAVGACLFQVGVGAGWQTFRHSGQDVQGNPLNILDRVRQLRDKTDHKPQPTVGEEEPQPEEPQPEEPPVEAPEAAPEEGAPEETPGEAPHLGGSHTVFLPGVGVPATNPAAEAPAEDAPPPPPPAEARIPVIYTNQQAIDTAYNAAKQLKLADDWALLIKAGQDVGVLAQSRKARYGGPPLDETASFTSAERVLVRRELLEQLVLTMLWEGLVTATDGLSLRAGPGTDQPRLRILAHEEKLQVLDDTGPWLFVLAGETPGYCSAQWVMRVTAPAPQPPAPTAREQALLRAWNRHGQLLSEESARLGIDPAVGVAVLLAESGGDGFGPDGRLKIRFENHIFLQQWGQHNKAVFDRFFRFNEKEQWKEHQWRKSENDPWQNCHQSQAHEWEVLTFARNFIEDPALKATSMGAAQIMGFNFATVGYASPGAMLADFETGDEAQVRALFRYIENRGLVEPLRQGDFVAFARGFNGPGQQEFYARLIQEYIAIFVRLIGTRNAIREMAALSVGSRGLAAPVPSADDTLWRSQVEARLEKLEQAPTSGPGERTGWFLLAVAGLAFVAGLILAILTRSQPVAAVSLAYLFGTLSVVALLVYGLSRRE